MTNAAISTSIVPISTGAKGPTARRHILQADPVSRRKKALKRLPNELTVGVDYPVESFNQLCLVFLSCDSSVSWLTYFSSGLETARGRWTDHGPASPDRDIVVPLETASPRSRGRNRKSINHETHQTHERKANAEKVRGRCVWIRPREPGQAVYGVPWLEKVGPFATRWPIPPLPSWLVGSQPLQSIVACRIVATG